MERFVIGVFPAPYSIFVLYESRGLCPRLTKVLC